MKVTIQFLHTSNKPDVFNRFLRIIPRVEQLWQNILSHGVMLEKLDGAEIEAMKEFLTKLKYPDFKIIDESVKIGIESDKSLLRLIGAASNSSSYFGEIIWKKGLTIEKLNQKQADQLSNEFNAEKIGTVITFPDTPEPLVNKVTGQVRWSDNTPFTESGYVVHVFDENPPGKLALLASVKPIPSDGSYQITYTWQPEGGRNGPNLVVQLLDPQNKKVAESHQRFAGMEEILDLIVKKTQPNAYILTGIVKNQVTGAVLPNLRVEAQFRANSAALLTLTGITDTKGVVNISFDETLFSKLPAGQQAEVIFMVSQDGQSLSTGTTIKSLQPGDQKVEILVTIPESTGEKFIVKGTIRKADGSPLPGVVVRAFDCDLRKKELLGEQDTNVQGFFEIGYTRAQFSRMEKAQADIYLELYDPDKKTVISPVTFESEDENVLKILQMENDNGERVECQIWFNAPAVATINGTVTDQRYRVLSEYKRYVQELSSLMEALRFEELTDADLNFLHHETAIPFEHLDYIRLDASWSLQHKLTPAALYGLFRQGLPTNLRQLLAEKPSRLREALERSIDEDIIPAKLAEQIDRILDQLANLAVSLAFVPEEDSKQAIPVGAKLETALLAPDLQRKVVEFIYRYEGDKNLWEALATEGRIEQTALDTVRFTLESSVLVFDHLPTLEAIQTLRQNRKWSSTRDLAHLKRSECKALVEKTITRGLPDGFENADAYAEAIVDRIEQAFPTAVVANRLAEDTKLSNNDINFFFQANPDFDLLHTPLQTYLKNDANLGQVKDRQGLTEQLKKLKRTAMVTPEKDKFAAMQGLLTNGLDSSLKIAATDEMKFQTLMSPYVDVTIATKIMLDARVRVDASNLYGAAVRDYSLSTHVLPGPTPKGDQVTWEKLFGSLSSCSCKHCRSVYSPAAYMVDLLEYLRKAPGSGTTTNLLTQLLIRCPDLEHILLNCDNANTPLPYIDLVNERLELRVSPATSPKYYQTEGSSELDKLRLRALPQYQHDPAYDTLSGADYPWILPFNLVHEETKVFGQIAEIKLFEIFELFNQGAERVARAHLGISQEVWDKIAVPASNREALAKNWGVTVGQFTLLDQVPEILTRSGLSYQELESLIDSPTFAYFKLAINRGAEPCNIAGHRLQKRSSDSALVPLNDDELFLTLDFIHRFVRLQRALRWTIEGLSYVLNERELVTEEWAQLPLVDSELRLLDLVDISKLMRLATRLRLSIEKTAQIKNRNLLARALGKREAEISYLIELSGIDPFVFGPVIHEEKAFVLTELENLLVQYDLLNDADLDLAEVRYLLWHKDLSPAVFEPTDTTRQAWLQNLYEAMQRSSIDFPSTGIDLVADSIQLAVDHAVSLYNPLLSTLTENERNALAESFRITLDGNLNTAVEAAQQRIESRYGDRIATEVVVAQFESTIRSVSPTPADPVLEAMIESFREQFTVDFSGMHAAWGKAVQAAIEYFGTLTGISVEHINLLLLPQWGEDGSITQHAVLQALSVGSGVTIPAIEDFLGLIRRPDDPLPKPLAKFVFEGLDESNAKRLASERMLIRLAKSARLIQLLRITPTELSFIDRRKESVGSFSFNNLPYQAPNRDDGFQHALFAGLLALVRTKLTQTQLPQAEKTLFDFMELAYDLATTVDILLSTLAEYTGWNQDPKTGGESTANPKPLNSLQAIFGFTIDQYRFPDSYALLKKAIDLMNQRQIPADALPAWLSLPAEGAPSEKVKEIADASRDKMIEAARTRYASDEDCYKAITPTQDSLRERKRDALVAYLLHHPGLWLSAEEQEDHEGSIDTNLLYSHFLIDVEMSACQLTSRIVQANSAIQLFVQRCLMNLEINVQLGDTEKSSYWQQWTWMKNYRVWEANRKVFLYPENWIEPDLRDDKSPFFKELENELLQSDVTQESVERAYASYFGKLDDVARLDVRGFYEEDADNKKALHVVARTFSEPHIYFYRKRFSDSSWTTWEKIDLSIESNHVFPVVFNNKLMLFWAVFKEEDEFWNLTFQWSVYRNGGWEAPKASGSPYIARFALRKITETEIDFPSNSFTFRVVNNYETNELRLVLFASYKFYDDSRFAFEGGDSLKVSSYPNYSYSLGYFRFDTCKQNLRLEINSENSDLSEDNNLIFVALRPNKDRLLSYPVNGMGFSGSTHGDTKELSLGINSQGIDKIEFTGLSRYYFDDRTLSLSEYSNLFDKVNNHRHKPKWSRHVELLANFTYYPKVIGRVQDIHFQLERPFFLEGDNRLYLVSPNQVNLFDYYRGSIFASFYTWKFEIFYHPYFCETSKRFNESGVNAILAPSSSDLQLYRQIYREPEPTRFQNYLPQAVLTTSFPYEQYDFSPEGAYSSYNWEIFFHIPLLIADRLSKNQRFSEAQRWFHYIFNPTDISIYPSPAKFWQVKPLFELAMQWEGPAETLEDMLQILASGNTEIAKQVEQWRNNPFNPHQIARLRLVAYMKTVVLKYLDNLIAWGDYCFQQDTIESINEATQLYILASEILGPRPVTISQEETKALSYSEIRDKLDEFSNYVLSEIDSSLPPQVHPSGNLPRNEIPPNLVLYFCLPDNEKLASYWDTVVDRLFKVRHCMNIEGQVRQLPLFAPPIDPALLVRARAMGLDLRDVIGQALDARPSLYRYQYLSQKALEFCSEVRSLGGALLAALEKKDAEELSLIRSRHELSMLKLTKLIKTQQIAEANETLEGLQASRKLTEKRFEFYSSREFMSANEISQTDNLHEAHRHEMIAQGFSVIAAIAHLFPDVKIGAPFTMGATYGGTNVGNAARATASIFSMIASQYSFEASMASIMGGHYRRQDEWDLQAELAQRELDQIDKQILAAQIRLNIAELDQANHEKQIAHAEETDAFLKSKFTNVQLYSWMVAQISALHYQSYRLAYDLAKKTEQALKHELALEDTNFIQFGHWDSMKKGLLAGERLALDLKRMEAAYLDQNKREYELVKHISLRQLDPIALLTLKATASCEITLPEWLFDLDNPGHYMRRIKNVSLSIPAVTGSYTGINCTLSLQKSTVRRSPIPNDPYPRKHAEGEEDSRFVDYYEAIQSIVTSNAQNDSGVFETNLRDERFLPFEGAGATSTWKLELPSEFRQFDYNSISDVILHMRYTAREGGDLLKRAATSHLQNIIKGANTSGLIRLFGLRHDFPSEWHRFVNGSGNFEAKINKDFFPYFIQGKDIKINSAELIPVEIDEPLSSQPIVINQDALQGNMEFVLSLPESAALQRHQDAQVFLALKYTIE
jgi:hypothetical protein